MKRRPIWPLLILLIAIILWLGVHAGSYLIIDAPRSSDVILVLAGETNHRPARALELLGQGYARRILIDVPANTKIYEFTQIELAQKYVHDLPQAASVTICPITGLSTKDESKDAATCIASQGAKSVLIVTSDFHTRRALSIYEHELPGYKYSVAASRDDAEFGAKWWTHRQWAKTFVDEWLRLLWWKLVDQWRRISKKFPTAPPSESQKTLTAYKLEGTIR
jgi:hypothetical protein